MRNQQNKLQKYNSTKAERKFMELLKKLHVSYRAKDRINGREVDFIVGKYAIDINGHKQDPDKNVMLAKAGYVPIHFSNREIHILKEDELINKIKKLC